MPLPAYLVLKDLKSSSTKHNIHETPVNKVNYLVYTEHREGDVSGLTAEVFSLQILCTEQGFVCFLMLCSFRYWNTTTVNRQCFSGMCFCLTQLKRSFWPSLQAKEKSESHNFVSSVFRIH